LNPKALASNTEIELKTNYPVVGKNTIYFLDNSSVEPQTFYIFARTSERSTNIEESNMKDLKLDQYFGITLVPSCRPGSVAIVENKYLGKEGDIQVTGTGTPARFILSSFNLSDSRCTMINIEVILDDEKKNSTKGLIVSMKDMIVTPVNPYL
jgi:hypothetical protein